MRLRSRLFSARRPLAWCLAALACGVQARAQGDEERSQAAQGHCFPVHRITLEGEAADQFLWVLDAAHPTEGDPAAGAPPQCLGQEAIARITQRAQGALIERGFVTTRVLVPAQDLGTGRLRLVIVPGRLGSVRLTPDALGRGTAWNAVPLRPGQVLNLRDLEQALENFQRVPTVEADIQIAPSEQTPERPDLRPGDSDLWIRWTQRLPLRLSLSVDDSGPRATGRYQGSFTFSYDNPLNLNDLFHVTLGGSLRGGAHRTGPGAGGQDTRARSSHYSVPWKRWLFAVQTSQQDYRQNVAGANQDYLYRGQSTLHDLRISRLLHRDATGTSLWSLRGWSRRSHNLIDDTEVEVQRRRTAGWELGVQHQRAAGVAAWNLGMAYRRGTGALQALAAPEETFGEGASRPRILTVDLSMAVSFGLGGTRTRYAATANAQWTQQALVPQDRFAIGGRHTVRGFDGESALSAARGAWLRQELQWALGDTGQALYLGLDHGGVGGAASDSLAGTRLTGAVIGLRGGLRNASWDLFAGRPVKRPEMFRTARTTAGFSAHLSF